MNNPIFNKKNKPTYAITNGIVHIIDDCSELFEKVEEVEKVVEDIIEIKDDCSELFEKVEEVEEDVKKIVKNKKKK